MSGAVDSDKKEKRMEAIRQELTERASGNGSEVRSLMSRMCHYIVEGEHMVS